MSLSRKKHFLVHGRLKKNHAYTKTTATKKLCTLIIFALGKGKKRLYVLEEVHPMKKSDEMRWVRGWDCGWTPYGLCFSSDWREDIHDNYIVPFKYLTFSVYVDQPADSDFFGFSSAVLARFSKKRDSFWEGRVYSYSSGWSWSKRKFVTYRIVVRTEFVDLKHQLEEAFHPSQVRLKGNTR